MTTPQRKFGIGYMASRHNVSFRTLRFYEQQGLLQPIREGQDRFYTAKDEIRLQLILKGKRLGFTLQEIGKLIGAASKDGEEPADETAEANIIHRLDPETVARQAARLEERRAQIDEALCELRAALADRAA